MQIIRISKIVIRKEIDQQISKKKKVYQENTKDRRLYVICGKRKIFRLLCLIVCNRKLKVWLRFKIFTLELQFDRKECEVKNSAFLAVFDDFYKIHWKISIIINFTIKMEDF